MAKTIPCPNPGCPHDFSVAELQSAPQLVCPKCGFRLQGKGTAPAKPAATPRTKAAAAPPAKPAAPTPPLAIAKPVAKPSAPLAQPIQAPAVAGTKVVMAMPVAPQTKLSAPINSAQTLAMPITAAPSNAVAPAPPPPAAPSGEESISQGMFFNPDTLPSTGTLVRAGRSKKKRNWIRILIVALILGFASSVVVIAGVMLLMFFGAVWAPEGISRVGAPEGTVYFGTIRNAKGDQEKVYKLVLAKKDWSIDSEMSTRFKAHAAWKHNEYEFWFALIVKDYGMLRPRDADMLREGIEKLEGHFGDALELAAKAESAKFGDLAVQKLAFKGQYKAASWVGECVMIFKDGIAYWLIIASPDPQTIEHFAAELPEKNIFVLTERRGWREQAPPTETFASSSGKLTMTVPKDAWKKDDAKNVDEKGELLLIGIYQKEKDNRKNASILIYTLDKQEDLKAAMKAAREYLEKKEVSENTMYKIVHAGDAAEGQGRDRHASAMSATAAADWST